MKQVQRRKPKEKSEWYVDKSTMFDAYVEYAAKRDEAKALGKEPPRITEYLGSCIQKIATGLMFSPNFIGYSYREEMISDAIENCFLYFDKFDPNRGSQIFSYYTQICYFAALRRIHAEKKQLYIKHKVLENSSLFDQLMEQQESDDHAVEMKTDLTNSYIDHFVRDYEASIAKAKEKKEKEKTGIEVFAEDVEENVIIEA